VRDLPLHDVDGRLLWNLLQRALRERNSLAVFIGASGLRKLVSQHRQKLIFAPIGNSQRFLSIAKSRN